VDICGRAAGQWKGIQCKCISADTVLAERELLEGVEKAKHFTPPLAQYLLATTGLKDAGLEALCRRITIEHEASGLFSVVALGWEDICLLLASHPRVAFSHFPFAVNPIVLNNEGAAPNLESGHSRYSFTREEFVHPRIIEELAGWISDPRETVVSVDLGSANRSNRFYGEIEITSDAVGPLVVHHDQPEKPFGRRPYFGYRHIGTSRSGIHVLHTTSGGGGTGHFNCLCFLVFQRDRGISLEGGDLNVAARERILIKTLGSIPLGDRYIGDIRFEDGLLSVGPDQEALGGIIVREGFSVRVH